MGQPVPAGAKAAPRARRMHAVIFVVSIEFCEAAESKDFELVTKFVSKVQTECGLPCIFAITKPDMVEPTVYQHNTLLDSSPKIRGACEKFAKLFTVPPENAIPVLTYHGASGKSMLREQYALRLLKAVLERRKQKMLREEE